MISFNLLTTLQISQRANILAAEKYCGMALKACVSVTLFAAGKMVWVVPEKMKTR